jgi:hypothetical protein
MLLTIVPLGSISLSALDPVRRKVTGSRGKLLMIQTSVQALQLLFLKLMLTVHDCDQPR